MKTWKVDLYGHGGSVCSVVIVGESIPAAIRDWEKRRYGADVISISEPYKAGEYHVEHTGRPITTFHFGDRGAETVAFDRFSNLVEIETL